MARRHIALATDADHPDLDEDGSDIVAALQARGCDASIVRWDDASVDWRRFDLVVLRCTWDYTLRVDAFLAWTATIEKLANPAGVIAWNTTKTYLRELAEAGVPVVPTRWCAPGEPFDPPEGDFVVKPAVSAGARDTARYAPHEHAAAAAHVRALHDHGRLVMVQPYQGSIEARGETALFFFAGKFSHAIRKEPLLAKGAPVAQWPASAFVSAREPSAVELDVARRVLAAVPFETLCYARVDLVPDASGAPVLLELEATEPRLFLFTSPGSVQRFVEAIVELAAK